MCSGVAKGGPEWARPKLSATCAQPSLKATVDKHALTVNFTFMALFK